MIRRVYSRTQHLNVANRWIEVMQVQTDALVTLSCNCHQLETPLAKLLGGIPQIKLYLLTEQDGIESYLVTFK